MSEFTPADPYGIKNLDLREPNTFRAIGNMWASGCSIDEQVVARMSESGLIDKFAQEASDTFTMVHATDRESAEKICREGFVFRGVRNGDYLGIDASFVEVVPPHYPNARTINAAVFGYRYQRGQIMPPTSAKVIVQLPIPFPEEASTKRGMHIGHLPLEFANDAEDAGLVETRDDGMVILPPRHIAGWVDMDTAEFHKTQVKPKGSGWRGLGLLLFGKAH